MDLEILKKKINSVSTNIAIYRDYLKKHKKELSSKYKLDKGNADDRLGEIEEKVKQLKKRKDKLYLEAKKTLKGMQDDAD